MKDLLTGLSIIFKSLKNLPLVVQILGLLTVVYGMMTFAICTVARQPGFWKLLIEVFRN